MITPKDKEKGDELQHELARRYRAVDCSHLPFIGDVVAQLLADTRERCEADKAAAVDARLEEAEKAIEVKAVEMSSAELTNHAAALRWAVRKVRSLKSSGAKGGC
jgi:hypothetical protein